MSGPGFAPHDLCSIRGAAEQDELAEAVRGGFSADGCPLGGDDPPAPLASGIDRAIRLSTAVAVLAVAGIVADVSYWHAYAVVRAHGGTGITARLEPATIDGLVYASSMVVLYAARHRVPVPCLTRWLLGLGIAAILTANMAQGWSHGPVGAVVAAWPAVSLVGSYELLVWLIRTSGTPEREPSQRIVVRIRRATLRSVPSQPPSLTADSTAGATAFTPVSEEQRDEWRLAEVEMLLISMQAGIVAEIMRRIWAKWGPISEADLTEFLDQGRHVPVHLAASIARAFVRHFNGDAEASDLRKVRAGTCSDLG